MSVIVSTNRIEGERPKTRCLTRESNVPHPHWAETRAIEILPSFVPFSRVLPDNQPSNSLLYAKTTIAHNSQQQWSCRKSNSLEWKKDETCRLKNETKALGTDVRLQGPLIHKYPIAGDCWIRIHRNKPLSNYTIPFGVFYSPLRTMDRRPLLVWLPTMTNADNRRPSHWWYLSIEK